MSDVNYDEKINLIKNKIEKDINLTRKKLKTSNILSFTISIFIMVINLAILVLASWALSELIKEIIEKKASATSVILPTIVALFTICLFILTILTSVYKLKSRQYYYKNILEEYQYLILKIKQKSISIEEVVDILNQINNKKFEYKKTKYSSIIKGALGG